MFTEMAGGAGPGVQEIASYATGGLVLASAAFKAVNTVPEGHEGLRLRFKKGRQQKDSIFPWGKPEGYVYKHVRPGAHLTMPFTHSIAAISVQDRNTRLPDIRIDKGDQEDSRQYDVHTAITWGVVRYKNNDGTIPSYGANYNEVLLRAYAASENAEELTQNVVGICTGGLRAFLAKNEQLPHLINPFDLDKQLQDDCNEELLDAYGVELRRVNLLNVARTDADILGTKLAQAHVAGPLGAAAAGGLLDKPGLRTVPSGA